ncbi:MAG: glycosyltransferase family 2 protein [Rhodospirillaceae bacterium]|nr:glycosyltransferase family 2 protein [Rhodospirillaceae bacterium]
MQTPPRIAIVIPAHNCANTLERAVSSIIASADHAHTTMGFDLRTEIVVVDDASTDATPTIISTLDKKLAEIPHITFKTCTHATNRGAGISRNEGVRLATAPFIGFLDADDEFLPPHIGCCLTELLADRDIGYVWTRRILDVSMHPSWGPSLDRRTVMNLCVRRIWHEIAKGFPEHPDFTHMGTEDSFYRIILEALTQGRALDEKTVLIHHSPGNSLDRQRKKLSTPITEWDGSKETFQPSNAIIAALNDRLTYIERLKSEMRGA